MHYSCSKCKTKLSDIGKSIVKYSNCTLIQTLVKAREQYILHAFIEVGKEALPVTLSKETIRQAIALAGKNKSPVHEDLVTETISSLPNLSITYDRKTKIVSEVALLEKAMLDANSA